MKKILKTLLLFVFLASSNAAFSEEMHNIAVVNMQKVLEESSAAKTIKEQIRRKRDDYQAQITKQEEELRSSDKQLSEQRTILSPEAFEEKRKEFKEQLIEMQRDVQIKRAELDKSLGKSLNTVQTTVNEIIKNMAAERGFSIAIAIPSAQILYSSNDLDITEDVLKSLNQKLPDVQID